MVFTPENWEFSNLNEEEYMGSKDPTPGVQYLLIKDAIYAEENFVYDVVFKCLDGDAEFRIRKFLLRKDGNRNGMAIKWHNALGFACCGIRTMLKPEELIGCLVVADVQMKPTWKDRDDPNAKLFPEVDADTIQPIPKEMMEYSGNPEQFYTEE